MGKLRQRKPRLKLDAKQYRLLREEVLRRDGWRGQWCGAIRNREVHHGKFRSRLGGDTAENLITLCIDCHRAGHRVGGGSALTASIEDGQ